MGMKECAVQGLEQIWPVNFVWGLLQSGCRQTCTHVFSRGRAVIVTVVVATQLQFLQQQKGHEWE